MDQRQNQIVKISFFSLFLLPIFVIIDIIVGFTIFSVIFLMILLTIWGLIGGKWLWRELTSSDVFKSGVPIYMKIIGTLGLVLLFAFLGIGFYLYYFGDENLIRPIVEQGTYLMYFAACYNTGYIISIWKPLEIDESSTDGKFKIKKKLSLIIFCVMILYVLGSFLIVFIITGEIFSLLFQYIAIGGVSLAIGWLFWEHLKESRVLSGELLKNLKILSVVFLAPVILLSILGIISNFLQFWPLTLFILLGYLLLFYLMAAYFVGLMTETIKK